MVDIKGGQVKLTKRKLVTRTATEQKRSPKTNSSVNLRKLIAADARPPVKTNSNLNLLVINSTEHKKSSKTNLSVNSRTVTASDAKPPVKTNLTGFFRSFLKTIWI